MSSLRLIIVILVAALGPFQFGYNTGVINAPKALIINFINATSLSRGAQSLSNEESLTLFWSFVVSVFCIGGVIGGLIVGYSANRIGRRLLILLLSGFGIVSGLIMACSKPAGSYEMLIIGRILVGFASGAYTGVVPMYLSEISPLRLRGAIGVVNQLAVVTGLWLSQIFGLRQILGTDELWPFLLGFTAIPAAIQLCLVPFVFPESPRYLLIEKSNEAAALSTLRLLGRISEEELVEEMAEMRKEREILACQKSIGVFGLFREPQLRWPLMIAVVMQLSQQLSGINGIFYYSSSFFENNAKLSADDAKLATLGVGAIMVVMTIICIPLIDRVGRKALHVFGLAGMLVSSIAITIFLSFDNGYEWAAYTGVAFSLAFVLFFAIGPGSIPWLITAELFEQSHRSAAISVATVVNWLANFVVGITFDNLNELIGPYVFIIFSVCLAAFLVFTVFVVPETKGKTFQEIARLFDRHRGVAPNCTDTDKPTNGNGHSKPVVTTVGSATGLIRSENQLGDEGSALVGNQPGYFTISKV